MCNLKILNNHSNDILLTIFNTISRDKITQSFLQNKKKYSFVILLYF